MARICQGMAHVPKCTICRNWPGSGHGRPHQNQAWPAFVLPHLAQTRPRPGHIWPMSGPDYVCNIWPRSGPNSGCIMWPRSGKTWPMSGPCLSGTWPHHNQVWPGFGVPHLAQVWHHMGKVRQGMANVLSAPYCRNWPRPGPDVATSGPGLAQIILPELGQIWPKPGPDSARPEPRSGPYLVCHIRPRSGIYLKCTILQNWPIPGPDVATTGPGLAQVIIPELAQICLSSGPDQAQVWP